MTWHPDPCYRCGEYGHFVPDCPELKPATTRHEHESRIAAYVERWINGQWAQHQKREAITTENKMWETAKAQKAGTRK